MGLFLIGMVPIGLLIVLRVAANNAELQHEQIEFDTQKTIGQISDSMRSLSMSSFHGSMEKLISDPLAGVDGEPEPVIEVLMSGKATMKDKFKVGFVGRSNWDVQVIVYDLGNKRHVILDAIGIKGLAVTMVAYQTHDDYVNLRLSKHYRELIAQALS